MVIETIFSHGDPAKQAPVSERLGSSAVSTAVEWIVSVRQLNLHRGQCVTNTIRVLDSFIRPAFLIRSCMNACIILFTFTGICGENDSTHSLAELILKVSSLCVNSVYSMLENCILGP